MDYLGQKICDKAKELGKFSESSQGLTRQFLTKEHKQSNTLIKSWMDEAGLKTYIDEIGNVVGEHIISENIPTLLLGSHQDSVKNGGIYDGMLGIIIPIVCLDYINKNNIKLNCNIKIIAFGDEEGTRFGTAYLSSSVLTGSFKSEFLDKTDTNGITLRKAFKQFALNPDNIFKMQLNADNLLGYIELHIEQGPVLDKNNLPVGIVTAINTSSRYKIELQGEAGHAGTVPINYRKDAGTGAAEAILEIEKTALNNNIVATVGQIEFSPGSVNVIPSAATFTLDLRSPDGKTRAEAFELIKNKISAIAERRKLKFTINNFFLTPACQCDKKLSSILKKGIENINIKPFELTSGAGHDAQEMSKITNIGMMFIRCKDGISHSPDESVKPEDIDIAARALIEALKII